MSVSIINRFIAIILECTSLLHLLNHHTLHSTYLLVCFKKTILLYLYSNKHLHYQNRLDTLAHTRIR